MWTIGAPCVLNALNRSAMRATASELLRRLPAASHSSKARWTSITMRAGRVVMAGCFQICSLRGLSEAAPAHNVDFPSFRDTSVSPSRMRLGKTVSLRQRGEDGVLVGDEGASPMAAGLVWRGLPV